MSALGEFPGAPDVLWVIFDADVAPGSVRAEQFVVMLPGGRRAWPDEATLGPADERGEHRSVVLHGSFRHEGLAPQHVRVIGSLYAEDGRPLEGAERDVDDVAVADRLVAARTHDDPECESGRAVLTFWSDALRTPTIPGPGGDDVPTLSLIGSNGALVPARRIVDHLGSPPGAMVSEAADDNVVGVCVDPEAEVVEVVAPAGIYVDARGRPTAEGRVRVTGSSPDRSVRP